MKLLVCFDFDHSLIPQDSDHFLIAHLLPSHLHTLTYPPLQWTEYMHFLFQLIYEKNIKEKEIKEVIEMIEMEKEMKELILEMFDDGAEFIILSDSNQVFIDTFLKNHQLENVFKSIYTNPAYFSGDRLHIQKRELQPHHCPLQICPVNLCKGKELLSYLSHSNIEEYDLILYIGDGKNDYCPAQKLRKTDVLYCKRNKSLFKILNDGSQGGENSIGDTENHDLLFKRNELLKKQYPIQATIEYWDTAAELKDLILKKIKK